MAGCASDDDFYGAGHKILREEFSALIVPTTWDFGGTTNAGLRPDPQSLILELGADGSVHRGGTLAAVGDRCHDEICTTDGIAAGVDTRGLGLE